MFDPILAAGNELSSAADAMTSAWLVGDVPDSVVNRLHSAMCAWRAVVGDERLVVLEGEDCTCEYTGVCAWCTS